MRTSQHNGSHFRPDLNLTRIWHTPLRRATTGTGSHENNTVANRLYEYFLKYHQQVLTNCLSQSHGTARMLKRRLSVNGKGKIWFPASCKPLNQPTTEICTGDYVTNSYHPVKFHADQIKGDKQTVRYISRRTHHNTSQIEHIDIKKLQTVMSGLF